jgi:predicted DNA-binding transcriptional regulator AlpA
VENPPLFLTDDNAQPIRARWHHPNFARKVQHMQRFLTLREVSERLGGRSRSALYVDMQTGRLPQPVRIGKRVYWGEDDLAAHLRALAAAAPTKGAA